MSYEAYISAKPPGAYPPPWFSFTYGNQKRSQNLERPPRARSQKAFSLSGSGPAVAVTSESKSLRNLKKRSQYLRAARGKRAGHRAFGLQMIAAPEPTAGQPGIGLTVTKKVGNSPQRNRIKRRLRAAAKACQTRFKPQHDYVLIGRRAALDEPFEGLVGGLTALIDKVHSGTNADQEKRNR